MKFPAASCLVVVFLNVFEIFCFGRIVFFFPLVGNGVLFALHVQTFASVVILFNCLRIPHSIFESAITSQNRPPFFSHRFALS